MIINIRGTSGSGKTAAVRRVMELAQVNGYALGDYPPAGCKPTDYSLVNPAALTVYVLGRYENVCGGCDGIKTQDEICERVRRFSRGGHVIFEGLLVQHIFKRYRDLAQELAPAVFRFALLDTPLAVCLDRVQRRRDARADARPFNPANTIKDWHATRSIFGKCVAADLDVRWVSHRYAGDVIWEWLRE